MFIAVIVACRNVLQLLHFISVIVSSYSAITLHICVLIGQAEGKEFNVEKLKTVHGYFVM